MENHQERKGHDQFDFNPAELAQAMHLLGQALGAAPNYDPSKKPDHGRPSVVAALVGVNQLIAALFPNEPALPIPLIDLACALKDLDREIVAPLLQAAKVGHRPPNTLSDELFRALPAAAMSPAHEGEDDAQGSQARGRKPPCGDGVQGPMRQ